MDPTLFRTFHPHSLISHVTRNVLSLGLVKTRITSFERATLKVSTNGSCGVRVLVGTDSEDNDATPIFISEFVDQFDFYIYYKLSFLIIDPNTIFLDITTIKTLDLNKNTSTILNLYKIYICCETELKL